MSELLDSVFFVKTDSHTQAQHGVHQLNTHTHTFAHMYLHALITPSAVNSDGGCGEVCVVGI